MWQVSIRIGRLPLVGVFMSDGSVAIHLIGGYPEIIEMGSRFNGQFFHDEFWIVPSRVEDGFGDLYSYRVSYNLADHTALREWLTQQAMPYPTFKENV